MKTLLALPLLGAVALLTGCAGPAYVESGPTRVYSRGPIYASEPVYGPGYYDRGPGYYDRGTDITVVRTEGRSNDRGHFSRGGRDGYGSHTSDRRRSGSSGGRDRRVVARQGGGQRPAAANAPRKSGSHGRDDQKKHDNGEH